VKGKILGRRRLAAVAGIVTPDTILRWYRTLVAKKYDGSRTRRPGRPTTTPDIALLVVRIANENPRWGYTRIRGGLKHLGHDIARNTIKAILKDHGIEPAPERQTKTPWKTFLAAQWDGLAAADFFTVEVLTMSGLVRYTVLFVMRLKTRTVEIAGITSQPNGAWMTQVARNLTAPTDGFLCGVDSLILDRDPLYTAAFRDLLRSSGVEPLLLPARSPNLNAFAERFVGSVRAECLDRIVPLGERHLRTAIRAFVDHYHEERPHQRLGNELIAPKTISSDSGQVQCRERLGGLLKFYYRPAA
jgi:putative transposase